MTCPCHRTHDVTFCLGKGCGRNQDCLWFVDNHNFGELDKCSMTDYGNGNGGCDHFEKKDFQPKAEEDK